MKIDKLEDEIISELSALYRRSGYKKYKPSNFEEYALYQENKDFLISKNVITFSDLSGKLMAIRPDVTLSLVNHIEVKAGETEKFFYNEDVYRPTTGGKNYKEISQTGVEVIGAIDAAAIAELTILICKTLLAVSPSYVLDISHMGFVQGLLNEFKCGKDTVAMLIKTKNLHDFKIFAEEHGVDEKLISAFTVAVSDFGQPTTALEAADNAALNDEMRKAVAELRELYGVLQKFGYGEKINIEFSAVGDADYYNGVIYNGYIEGVPHCVLTGGRYDKLLHKMNKRGGAIGFALYLGEIERYLKKENDVVDYLILYDKKTQIKALELAGSKQNVGYSVRISPNQQVNVAYKTKIDLTVGEVDG